MFKLPDMWLPLAMGILSGFCILSSSAADEDSPFLRFQLPSPFQAIDTHVEVLVPDSYHPESGNHLPVLYVLPVSEAGNWKHGHGLMEIKKLNVHNQFNWICVAPEFTAPPWYADHDSDNAKKDESHLIQTVIPFIDARFTTVANGEGRYLIGFSKSGWGAITLILRHPDKFTRVAAWDTGIRIDTGPISTQDRKLRIQRDFGSSKNFENFRISSLIKKNGAALGTNPRIFYFNVEGKRGLGGAEIHHLMIKNNVPHRYVFESKRPHRWDSGWIPEAIAFLNTGQ